MILTVVLIPTSLETKTSSNSSRTSSSTLDLPITALPNFEKKLDLDFSKPLLSVCFFSLEKIFLSNFMIYGYKAVYVFKQKKPFCKFNKMAYK